MRLQHLLLDRKDSLRRLVPRNLTARHGSDVFALARLGGLASQGGSSARGYASSSTRLRTVPPFAFAFDIDGVLMHTTSPIPGASEALNLLNDLSIPFILLTNGGGKSEAERAAYLSEKLRIPLSVDNLVQAHTPFRRLVDGPENLRDKVVLVTGADAAKCRDIAEGYGYNKVVIPADILRAQPTVFPFDPLMREVYTNTHRPLPAPLYGVDSTPFDDALRFDAIFVFNDPRDWALDIQVILDALVSSSGVFGTCSTRNGDTTLPNAGWQSDSQPTLYFSNSDLMWSTPHPQSRLAQGAFQAALFGIWSRMTGGRDLQRVQFGKPWRATYCFAEDLLVRHRLAIFSSNPTIANPLPPLQTVYMVGDNPESDIQGANDYKSDLGTAWHSILVQTGVWKPHRDNHSSFPSAKTIVPDVAHAVKWALANEGFGEPTPA